MKFWTTLGRSCRLRCPCCGRGRLFRGWFAMEPACAHCGLTFQREPGYFLGSIYFNYGMTALLVTVGYFAAFFGTDLPQAAVLWSLTAFCVLFPIWFFRYARSFWIGMDRYFDRTGNPPPDESNSP